MHVLFENPYFAPAWGYGGPTRLLYELTRQLVQAGVRVTVVTSNSADGPTAYTPGRQVEEGVNVVRLRIMSQHAAFRHKKFISTGYIAALRELLGDVDVMHLGGSRDYFVTIAARMARSRSIPYVHSAYGCLPRAGHGWKRLAKPLFDRMFTRDTVQGARLCIAQTTNERDVYEEFGVDRSAIRLIPLASDGERFRTLPPRGSFRERWGIGESERLILFVGRINYLKGLDILMESFKILRRRLPASRLVVVGRDDGYLEEFTRLAGQPELGGRVLFAGPLYGEDVLKAYVDADVFSLTPRHFEETTLAGVEACLCGTQVVVTKQAEIPYLEESGAGRVVENHPEVIAEAWYSSLNDEATIVERGAAARSMALTRFTWTSVLPLYLECYRSAAGAA